MGRFVKFLWLAVSINGSSDSIVDIAQPGHGANYRGTGVRFPAEARDFSLVC
jgi:hypothetical protein